MSATNFDVSEEADLTGTRSDGRRNDDSSFRRRWSSGDDTHATTTPVYNGDSLTEDAQTFTLKPLVEMGVVGACRRGRRRGRRNRTVVERQTGKEQRRRSKNARERERVENVRNEYAKLQTLLGLGSDDVVEGTKERRRFCKLRVLTTAIERIKTLMELMRSADEEAAGSVQLQAVATTAYEHRAVPRSSTVRHG